MDKNTQEISEETKERVARFLEEAAELPAEVSAAIFVSLGQMLASIDKHEFAKLLARPVIVSSYAETEEERQMFMAFGQSFALAVDAIKRRAMVEKWTEDLSGGRIPLGGTNAPTDQEYN